MNDLIIHAWTIFKFENKYYIPYTHWSYLSEIVLIYDKVTLLSPVKLSSMQEVAGLISLDALNLDIIEMPFASGYVSTVKYFRHYLRAYKNAKSYTASYARYPVPFGWLQKFYLKSSKRIVHFVGDPIDATRNNPNFGWIKKALLICFFMPEHLLYMYACKGASVYANGEHLVTKLAKYGVGAKAVISSTLMESDFTLPKDIYNIEEQPKLLYVGYLRKAKGVETVIRAFGLLQQKYPKACLTIVGTGDFHAELQSIGTTLNLDNIDFLGHIDDRNKLNMLFLNHDIFCFGSLSEGSPRVILEAMANGINVVSTPVGSLPQTFEDKIDILFSDFNDPESFYNNIDLLINDSKLACKLRFNAYERVKSLTLPAFIKKIFDET